MAFTGELAGYGERVTLHPQDTHGLLDLDGLLGTPQAGHAGLRAAVRSRCSPAVEERMAAWPAGSLHLERFAAPVVEATRRGTPRTSTRSRWCWRSPGGR